MRSENPKPAQSPPVQDVKAMLIQRCFTVLRRKKRRKNVVLMSCAGGDISLHL